MDRDQFRLILKTRGVIQHGRFEKKRPQSDFHMSIDPFPFAIINIFAISSSAI